jgi:RNA polymerase sigma-70 factor (ECF subfamily)
MSESDLVGDLLARLQSGDPSAADELYRRYAQRLCAIADRQLGRRLRAREDPEDVVQSAFRTFFRRAADGQFQVDHASGLWNLLVTITLNKVRLRAQRHGAGKRNVRAEVGLDLDQLDPRLVAREPTVEEAAAFIDELDFILCGLQDPDPEIVRLCFQGYSPSEIAARVNCSRWTVRRVLDHVGDRLRRRLRIESA